MINGEHQVKPMTSQLTVESERLCACGCGRNVKRSRGILAQYCKGHHVRRPLQQRFWEKVNKDGPVPEHRPDLGPCWVWTGAHDKYGYGGIGIDNQRRAKAHRIGYEIQVGPIPDGLELDHLCRTPACVRGSHLEPVTHRENVLRGNAPSAITHRTRICKRGHPFEGDNLVSAGPGQGMTCRQCQNMRQREWKQQRGIA